MFDAMRLKELDGMVRRMGAIVSVFEVRSSTVGNQSFTAFRELMDVYIDACGRNMREGEDFVEKGVQLNSNDILKLNEAFRKVFGAEPMGLTPKD
ncbi:hypothetical protein [Thalassobaculum sp.]|uniref:hypothetical protein n=1 Tax=Thalassobaculum sp. TaxID=2022740 RepID=UPI003B598FD1